MAQSTPLSTNSHTAASEDNSPSTPQKEAIEIVMISLDDAKAEDIVQIDMEGRSPLSDYMVVASGRSQRHVGAIADQLIRALKQDGHGSPRVEGLATGDWVLLDAGDVVVHIFRPEVREFYNLEKMWSAEPPEDADSASSSH